MKLNKDIESNLKNYRFLKAKLKNINLELEVCDNSTKPRIEKLKNLTDSKIKQIDHALNALNDKEREIIGLRYFHEKSWKEISNIIGLDNNYLMLLRTETINKMGKYF